MSELKSKYAALLNALDDMQQSMVYAARKPVLRQSEMVILTLEAENASLKAALPPAMTWTTQKPTIPGWYWYRIADHERTFILYVDVMGGATACGVLRDCMRDVGEWAGPLEPPQ